MTASVVVGGEEFPIRDLFAEPETVFQAEIDAVTAALRVSTSGILRRAERMYHAALAERMAASRKDYTQTRTHPEWQPDDYLAAASAWANPDFDKSLWVALARAAYLREASVLLNAAIVVDCQHPDPLVLYVHKANTGGWSTNSDRYWTEFQCFACRKNWRMDGSYNHYHHPRYGIEDESSTV